MRNRTRTRAATLAAGVLLWGLAGCASHGGGTGSLGAVTPNSGGATPGGAQPSLAPTPSPTPTPPHTTAAAPPPVAAPLTCAQLKSAEVGSATVSYNGYHDGIPLGGLGLWSGEDGNTVTLQPQCGIGDLDGDGAADAIGVVALTSGGTGDFYTLVVWRNSHGHPVCVAVDDLGDRNPVGSVTIAGGQATVVYYTRTSDVPMAEINVKRTVILTLSGHHLTEVSRIDIEGTFSL